MPVWIERMESLWALILSENLILPVRRALFNIFDYFLRIYLHFDEIQNTMPRVFIICYLTSTD